ncbi:hypothetical protein D9758_001691 [Tetrapyrgos nigripes]|uniref:Argonaute linker 1 domain-containing protein n=1 Tax=Tetrapyrgos nigripes TaxID=182062 RepID=A0A8H5LXF1_9AGAR|nr:hypothetical protein D9758_001691 [Tetrapyrgos nigripes]
MGSWLNAPSQPQPFSPPTTNAQPPNQIDSLFQHLSSSSPSESSHQQQPSSSTQSATDFSDSLSTSPPMAVSDEQVSTPTSNADRQSALLSLLGGAPSAPVVPGPQQTQPQQMPTPPGSSQRSGASPTHNETQGKILLEQLMSGNQPRSNYSESQRGSIPDNSSPPYAIAHHDHEYRPYNQQDLAIEIARGPQASNASTQQPYQISPTIPPPPQPMNQPPSPPKSMFDFVSPFDALSASSTSTKKRTGPAGSNTTSGNEDSSWSVVSDPKRQSVDNLLETLTRPQVLQTSAEPFDPYGSPGDYAQAEVLGRVPPPPLPPKPTVNRQASPPRSPPKPQAQRPRVMDSPASQHSQLGSYSGQNGHGGNNRTKESSPGPGNRGSMRGKKNKNANSPVPQAQTIVFDVSQPLDEIQASRDYVKSTAIALVRQDSVFLPGTTIGATHWVAYAMTRGRIRVISRSSGDRTLLQLPPVFATNASVIDMAVYGNRLAGVTSDGGFVVWELPDVITDDVPGQLLLCVAPPSNSQEPLQFVKWHPKEPDTLAVASESQIYLIDLVNTHALRGQTLPQSDLHHIGTLFHLASALVAFDFDVLRYALATITVDSTLTLWNTQDLLPYTTHKVRGEDIPSSLTFVDGGIVVGRKNGTIFQLLSTTTKAVLSTVKFVNGAHDDPDMFGHVSYDSRIQTLWVANCRRESMIAIRMNVEPFTSGGEDAHRAFFDQIVEFPGPKPTIHFVILTAESDPTGDESYAACVAAKVPPGELALVAFSVHSSGVDQILIRREWFDSALASTQLKYPQYTLSQMTPQATEPIPSKPQRPQVANAQSASQLPQAASNIHARARSPPSAEEIEADSNRDESRTETKGKGSKGKNVNWHDNGNKNTKSNDSGIINESTLGQALTKEIKKTEDNLHNRITRLLTREMDKQNQRFEEARANEQEQDFARQETILKLISTELTRNTTRVVEVAVKAEVQNSVLPALENITKNEVKAALNDQVGRGLVDYISQSLPGEIEKLLMRPDISSHFSHLLSANLTPLIERHVKDAIQKTLIPVYSQQSSAMHQDLIRDLRSEMHSFKSELTGWQNESLRSQENSIRDLERTIRALSDQVKYLSMNQPSGLLHHIQPSSQTHNSPGSGVSSNQPPSHLRQQNLPPSNMPPSATSQVSSSFSSNFQPQGPPPVQPQWFPTPIAAPQASHPATILQPPPQADRSPPIKSDQWDEIYLSVLHTQDISKLRELLARTNPELIMPLNSQPLVSQAVILTLVHRLSAAVGETSPSEESFKTSLWWLQRSVTMLRPEDKLITDFIPRVIPNVQVLLNTTKQRLAIPIPGAPPTLDIARAISDVQETLRRKVMPVMSRFGTVGTPLTAISNSFELRWSSRSVVFHYNGEFSLPSQHIFTQHETPLSSREDVCADDVVISVITPEWENRSGKPVNLKAEKGVEIMMRLQTQIAPQDFPRPGAFDGKKNLFSFQQYGFPAKEVMIIADPVARLTSVPTSLLQALVQGQMNIRQMIEDGASDALNMLNFFVQAEPRRKGSDYKMSPLKLFTGYFQSVRPGIQRIVLNVDVGVGAVLPQQTLEQTCASVLGLQDRRGLLDLRDRELQKLRQFLKGVKVTVQTGNRRREKSIRDFIPDVGKEEFDKDGRTCTVSEHYARTHRMTIPPRMPGVRLGNHELIPIHICTVVTQLYKVQWNDKVCMTGTAAA